MTKYELVAIVMTVSMIGAVVLTVITSWFRYKEKQLDAARRPLAAADDRLARIEAAVDAMAVEVERIAEGQRFTSKLLADRQPSPAAVGASRNDVA